MDPCAHNQNLLRPFILCQIPVSYTWLSDMDMDPQPFILSQKVPSFSELPNPTWHSLLETWHFNMNMGKSVPSF